MNRSAISLPAVFVLAALTGCAVPMRTYRTASPIIAVASPNSEAPPAITEGKTAVRPPPATCDMAKANVCLGFIELDDMGEMFDAAQLQAVLKAIGVANSVSQESPNGAPMVVAFVHGWNHNASETDTNVEGFTEVLQRLSKTYGERRKIIGVYIGWRGKSVKRSWPVAMELSYFDREAAAVRIPGPSLSSAFTQIALRAHENRFAQVVYLGHSFGGLLLERALAGATADAIDQQSILSARGKELAAKADELERRTEVAGTQPTPAVLAVEEIENLRARAAASMAAAETATASRADLVIFVNTAAAATQSIQLIDLFGGDRLRYQPSAAPETKIEAADNAGDPPMPLDALDRPLFVSITSTVDAVTKLAMPIGHGIQYYALEATGSFRDNHPLQCFDPFKDGAQSWTLNSAAEGARRQRAFYMITAPHLAALESHWMLKATGKDQMRVSSTGEIVKVKDALAISKCDAGLFDKDMHVTSTFRLPGSETCYAIRERPNRCNGTPYWAMEVDPDVLYDHSDIFTDRFITFLIETFFQTPSGPLTRKNPVLLQETP